MKRKPHSSGMSPIHLSELAPFSLKLSDFPRSKKMPREQSRGLHHMGRTAGGRRRTPDTMGAGKEPLAGLRLEAARHLLLCVLEGLLNLSEPPLPPVCCGWQPTHGVVMRLTWCDRWHAEGT